MAENDFDAICQRMGIPEGLRKHVAASTPPRAKMAVARGLLPVPPKTLISMQYVLLGDPAKDVAAEAEKALLTLPEDRLLPLLDRETHPKLLEFFAYRRADHQRLAEQIALSHQINDKTLCYLAEFGSSRVAEIVAGNQERLIITPQVRLFLARNSNAGRALVDRVVSFQRLYGIDLEEPVVSEPSEEDSSSPAAAAEPLEVVETPPPVDAPSKAAEGTIWSKEQPDQTDRRSGELDAARLLPDDFVPGDVYLPPVTQEAYVAPDGFVNPIAGLLSDWGISSGPNDVVPPFPEDVDSAGAPLLPKPLGPKLVLDLDVGSAVELTSSRSVIDGAFDLSGATSLGESDFTFDFHEDTTDFDEEFTDASASKDEDIRQNLQQKLSKMSMADKIKLAYKGNKSARELLVRDTNKIIGVAVVKSGRITESEIMTIASNRSINEDVIRALSENREYLRKYPVKLALANNPKTPIPTAMGLLNSLHVNDLKKLASNRNVSSAIFTQAGKLFKARKASMR